MTPDDLYRSELRFLLKLREAVGPLNNRIHDNLARIAIIHFKTNHPEWRFSEPNAGASGFDIKGVNEANDVKLIAEVKTTLPDFNGRIRGPQIQNINNDLEKLRDYPGNVLRYLVVLSTGTVEAVRLQLEADTNFPTVEIFNTLIDDSRNFTESDE